MDTTGDLRTSRPPRPGTDRKWTLPDGRRGSLLGWEDERPCVVCGRPFRPGDVLWTYPDGRTEDVCFGRRQVCESCLASLPAGYLDRAWEGTLTDADVYNIRLIKGGTGGQ